MLSGELPGLYIARFTCTPSGLYVFHCMAHRTGSNGACLLVNNCSTHVNLVTSQNRICAMECVSSAGVLSVKFLTALRNDFLFAL